MKALYKIIIFSLLCSVLGSMSGNAQTTLRGKVFDAETGEELIGAAISIVNATGGTITNYEGDFSLKVAALPVTLRISYTGYSTQEVVVSTASDRMQVKLAANAILIEETVIRGQRVDDKQKSAPLTVENLDAIAIKETPAVNFYSGLGNLKGVDLTTASLGFTIINTRGFNSTSPVRSLQTIDGVDNQAPGLNFSLGNFLGSSDLDVNRVELIQGASSAYYGPNAFNGVIAMETKNPFIHRGLSASIKGGSRNLLETAVRYADAYKNKDGHYAFAFKANLFYLRADDWEATNYNPIDNADSPADNPGRFDAVNIYGDEYYSLSDLSDPNNLGQGTAGLGIFYRTGYKEIDMVDYDTRNTKANLSFHLRTNPSKEFESPELILSSSYGTGTTVYQGDNRFSLRGIKFFQNRLEFRKKDKFFIRAYATNEDAGDSYDPYFTSLRMQTAAKSNEEWSLDYSDYWQSEIYLKKMRVSTGPDDPIYPTEIVFTPEPPYVFFNPEPSLDWLAANQDSLTYWHAMAEQYANLANGQNPDGTVDFFAPGTARFQTVFDSITSLKSTEGGTRFFDKSALFHTHGEYIFNPSWTERITVGANARLYTPNSEGTIFTDTVEKITNFEFGVYSGIEKHFANERLIASATLRLDKNQNFDLLATPAASLVWKPGVNDYLRFSFSSAIRNPTLTDQYLNLNVGRAILLGNLNGFNNLITVESFYDFLDTQDFDTLVYFNAPPIKPEKVKTFEVGYRTTLFKNLYVDAGYYFSIYRDFIGYNIGIYSEFDSILSFPKNTQAYRVAANSTNEVTTQGFAIGLNYFFKTYYMVGGNYSWNKLNKTFADDPIIPAFNTPEHKYNLTISGRDIPINLGFARLPKFGFNVNYKWIQGFTFEGSPQFTGAIPTYDLVDAQINTTFDKIHTTFKLGCSNLLDNRVAQVYGGPRIGRMAYLSLVYDFVKK